MVILSEGVLRHFILGPQGFEHAGVFVRIDLDKVSLMQAKLQSMLTDGEGLGKCLEWNGHSSLRPCFGHSNVFMKNGGMEDPEVG